MRVCPSEPGTAYTGNLFCDFHCPPSCKFQVSLFARGGVLELRSGTYVRNALTPVEAARYDFVQGAEIHGAKATYQYCSLGRWALRVTLLGMYNSDAFTHGSEGSRSGTKSKPSTSPPSETVLVERVRMWSLSESSKEVLTLTRFLWGLGATKVGSLKARTNVSIDWAAVSHQYSRLMRQTRQN